MSSGLTLLLSMVLLQAGDRQTFSCPEGNYRVIYDNVWRRAKPPNENVQLALVSRRGFVFVAGLESQASIEEVVDAELASEALSAESVKEISRQETRVAGENALTVGVDVKLTGARVFLYLTAFTHQGVAYRVKGGHAGGENIDFRKDYEALLQGFAFAGERKEWLAKYEGKPAPSALLGGLVTYQLNRPRWMEATFEEQRNFHVLDQAIYRFLPGGAVVTIRARESQGLPATELEDLRHYFTAQWQDCRSTPLALRSRQGEVAGFEITGKPSTDAACLVRAAAVVEDGITVQFWMECYSSQREVTLRDWQQLVGSLHLRARSKPGEELAYSPPRRFDPARPNPAVAIFLARATRVFSGQGQRELFALSPDGSRALVRSGQAFFLESLRSRRRDAVSLAAYAGGPIAWSRDGKRLAYPVEDEVVIVLPESRHTFRMKARAHEVSFGPAEDEILVCTRGEDDPVPGRVGLSRLEVHKVGAEGRRTLVEFPLGRVAHVVAAPDRRSIALVTNRDYPRTVAVGGHLYLCQADGTGLRQLTREPEDITSLAWSPDARWIYAVRRLAVGENGAVGPGGSADLYRVSPTTGAAVNLTRSGGILDVWCAGTDLILRIDGWDVSAAQRGTFRIAAHDLEKATADRRVPPVSNPRALAQQVAAQIREQLGATAVRDLIPTPALMERLAAAFARVASEASPAPLDFSVDSLDRLAVLVHDLDLGSGREPLVLLGLGAYYGETLRRVAGAEWKLKPVPFGEWVPGRRCTANALVDVVLPFSDPYRSALQGLEDHVRTRQEILNREQNQKLFLVYPPSYCEEAVRQETPAEYLRTIKLLDAGEVQQALAVLAQELKRRPKNRLLAQQVIAVCEAAGLPGQADELSREAVNAGNEVAELLVRCADRLAKQDVTKALGYYRRAVQGDWPAAAALLKLGQHYQTLGKPALAETCWRRAYWTATEPQKRQIRQELGIPVANPEP